MRGGRGEGSGADRGGLFKEREAKLGHCQQIRVSRVASGKVVVAGLPRVSGKRRGSAVESVCVPVFVCVRVCARAGVFVCVRVCERAGVFVCVWV